MSLAALLKMRWLLRATRKAVERMLMQRTAAREGYEEEGVTGHGTGESEGNSAFLEATLSRRCLLSWGENFPMSAT